MQNEQLMQQTGQNASAVGAGEPGSDFDFSDCQRMKKLTTHDIYRFKQGPLPLIVKLFSSQSRDNYAQEVQYLSKMDNPYILRILHHRPAINPDSPSDLEKSHIIVMKQALRGDLNDYLPKYGRMSEKMARTYFRQIVEALNAAYKLKPAIIHPNLLASSILIDNEGQVKICGWSQLNDKCESVQLAESMFACGEILICLMTSFMPFYKKYSPTDTFYKFINPEHMHKFWNELLKRISKIDKKFQFSQEFMDLVEAIFLKKLLTFDEILAYPWLKSSDVIPNGELKAALEENEKTKDEKILAKKKQEQANEQKRKRMVHEYQLSFGLNRSKCQNQQFIKDYEESTIRQDELPISEGLFCLKIEGAEPSFVIASLKEFLREQNGKLSVILYEQFILNNFKVAKVNNYAVIDLDFELSQLEEEDQPLQPEIISLKLRIDFMRNNKQIFANICVVESNFNAYYTNLALKILEEKIQKRRIQSETQTA